MGNESETRERIIQATIELLDVESNVDKITVRAVAQRANVGIGLINYHFHTRDNLLSIAIGSIMAKMATGMGEGEKATEEEPSERIRTMLKSLYSFAEKHEKLIQFLLTHGIINGDMDAALYLVPMLREVFGNRKDEMQLRIIALQILLPIQVASINPTAFYRFAGVDLHQVKQREIYIDTLVDNLIGPVVGCEMNR
jgi:AcrR family transcriptional regulator